MNGKSRIMIIGPEDDGTTYVVESRTTEGDVAGDLDYAQRGACTWPGRIPDKSVQPCPSSGQTDSDAGSPND
jgi:hypothetical protein